LTEVGDVEQRAGPSNRRWLLLFLIVVVTATGSVALVGDPTTPEPTQGSPVVVTRDLQYHPSAQLDVYRAGNPRDLPVLVMLHGCCGGREDLFQLAHEVASRDVLVFNAGWTPIPAGGGYPEVYEQAACAVRFARSSAARFGGDGSVVGLLAFSDGALLGAAATLATPQFEGECPLAGRGDPDMFVGVSGFYGWQPGYVVTTPEIDVFFGGSPAEAPRAWERGNPYHHLSTPSSSTLLLIAGAEDPLVADAACFDQALLDTGHDARLEIIGQAGHFELVSPRIPAGRHVVDLTLSALIRDDFPTDSGIDGLCSTRTDSAAEE
jgi:acetyl esterase/lipase